MIDYALQHYFSAAGWPKCAICCKPVDRLESADDIYTHRRVFRAFCHGQVDEATLDAITVEDSIEIKFTWAFQRPGLEKPNEKIAAE